MYDDNQYDPKVLTELQQGDAVAWNKFYKEFAQVLYQFTRKIVADQSAAKDIVSEVFESIWLRREHLSTIHDYKAYMFVAARNRSLDYLRHEHMKGRLETDIKESVYGGYEADFSDDMAAQAALLDIISRLHKEIVNLPPRESQVARMMFIEGKSTKEVADDLAISRQTVRNISSSVVRKMRYKLPLFNMVVVLCLQVTRLLCDWLPVFEKK